MLAARDGSIGICAGLGCGAVLAGRCGLSGAGAVLCSAGIGLVGPQVGLELAFALLGCRCAPACKQVYGAGWLACAKGQAGTKPPQGSASDGLAIAIALGMVSCTGYLRAGPCCMAL